MSAMDIQPVSLLDKNSLGIPAACDEYIEVADIDSLQQAVSESKKAGQEILILGEGTNIVFAADFHGKIIRPCISGIQLVDRAETDVFVRVGAGENWHQLVCWALQQGFYGLENLALIPGSCGAAPVQNIGAYGVEISQLLASVEYVDLQTSEQKILDNAECGFGYRDSCFKHALLDQAVITHINLVLSTEPRVKADYPALKSYLDKHDSLLSPRNVFDAVCNIRSSKLPDIRDIPNAGSFFKNPVVSEALYRQITGEFPDCPGYMQGQNKVKIPAAWLIDQRGWKGRHHSGVGVHDQQALVLVNPGHSQGHRVIEFARLIQKDIASAFGIDLEIEPRVIL